MTKIEPFHNPPVSGFHHTPEQPALHGLVLTHGAGANCETTLLVNLADAFVDLGWAVLRCDLPFRQKRKFGPPHPSLAAADRDGLRAAVRALRTRVSGAVYLGGHSYGGRQASMVAAESPDVVPGLLLLSYPLHPPKKPQELRTAHFPKIVASTLFVHGTADPFGSREELEDAIRLMPAPTRLISFPGLGHDLGKGKSELAENMADEFRKLVSV